MPFFIAKTSEMAVDLNATSNDEVMTTFLAVDENGDGVLDTAEAAAFVFELMRRSVQLSDFAKTDSEHAGAMIHDLTTSLSLRCPLTLADVKTALHTRPDEDETAGVLVGTVQQFVNDGWVPQQSPHASVTTSAKDGAFKQRVSVAGYTTDSALAFLDQYLRGGCLGHADDAIQNMTVADDGTAHITYKPVALVEPRDLVVSFAPVSFGSAHGSQWAGWTLSSAPSADARYVHIDIVAAALVVRERGGKDGESPAAVDVVFASAVDLKLNWFTKYLGSAAGVTGARVMQRVAGAMHRALSSGLAGSNGPCHSP